MKNVIEDWRIDDGFMPDHDHQRKAEGKAGIEPRLRIGDHRAPATMQDEQGQQAEGKPGNEHEEGRGIGGRRVVEIGKRGVVRRIPARRHGGHGVGDRIERTHAAGCIGDGAYGRDDEVDDAGLRRNLGNARQELARHVRAFNLEELHAANTQHWQDRDGGHDDADAANPLQDGAPEQDAARGRVEAGHHSGTRGGQAGNGFKHRIREGHAVIQEGDGRDHRKHDPDHHRKEEGLPRTCGWWRAANQHGEAGTDQDADCSGDQEDVPLFRAICDVEQG